MKSLTLICLLLMLCAHLVGQGRASKIDPNGETTVSAFIAKVKLVAVFQTSSVEVSNDDKIPRFPQCTYSRIPCVIVRQLKLFVNDAEVFLPRSVYADLGDIQSAEFSSKNGLFVLTLMGGDASESYTARIVFDKRLRERRLYSGEDRIHALEVTRYNQVTAVD
jgi:hypothetical protein